MDTAGNSRGNYNLIHSTPNQAGIIILFMLRMKGILTNLEMESCKVIDGFIILLEKLYFVNKKTNAIFCFLRCQFCHSCRFNSL